MGFEDRDYNQGGSAGGGWRAALGRVFENPDNPLTWSFKVMRAFAIDVRVHLIMVIYIVAQLLGSLVPSAMGPGYLLMAMGALFGLVLIHEFGHCFACRWVGGEANRIVMLPWGGLALVMPPHDWRSNLITTLGGPAVHVVIFPITAAILLATNNGWGAVLFNPFDPGGALSAIWGGAGVGTLLRAVWWVHYINMLLFAFNMLLPMYPFDGGRVVHAVLWRSMGFRKALAVSVTVGFVGALVLGAVALVTSQVMLLIIAVFGGISCWTERQRLQSEVEIAGASGFGAVGGPAWGDGDVAPAKPSRRELKLAQREEEDNQEEDRILAKIANEGMQSLTRSERKFLDRLREKKRAAERR